MASLQQNIMQAISDFNGVRSAIENNGVSVPIGTDTSEYGSLINQACTTQYNEGAASVSICTKGITDFYAFCQGNQRLDIVNYLDTSNGTNLNYMFDGCNQLINPPVLNTQSAAELKSMFQNCSNMEGEISLDFSNAVSVEGAFLGCLKLTGINLVNTSKVASFSSVFSGCRAVETITGLSFSADVSPIFAANSFIGAIALKNIIVSGDLKINSSTLRLSSSPLLTVESMMSFINAFVDSTGGTRYTVYFGTTNLNKLTAAQKAIAENKNIALA